MPTAQTRRRFVAALSLAATGGLIRPSPAARAEGTPETTTLRLTRTPALCIAPQYIAEELLRAEGFSDLRYVDTASATESANAIGNDKADLSFDFVSAAIMAIDAGQPITLLAGAMAGCVELFAKEGLRTVADLKGQRVGLRSLGTSPHVLASLMTAEVGLDPARDIDWVVDPKSTPIDLFVGGKVDVFVGNPPESLDLRAQRMGKVLVKTAVDRPWSEYFCCMLAGNRDYVRRHPAATKRVVRAFLKAADLCARAPEQAARTLVAGGFTDRYEYALQTLNENPYGGWRDYGAEDSVRFYALRLHDLGFVKSSPQKILAAGTDFRFFDQLTRELKA